MGTKTCRVVCAVQGLGFSVGREVCSIGLVDKCWSRRGGGEKLSVESDQAWMRGTAWLLRRGVVVVLRKAAFSSRKAVLVTKK